MIKSIQERIGTVYGDKETIEELRKSGKPILIYGCANHAELVYSYLHTLNLYVEAFVVDSQFYTRDFYINGIEVRDIADYVETMAQYNIVVGFCNVDKSRFLINNLSILKSDFYLLWEPLKTYEWDEEYLNRNWKAIQEVYNDLADWLSKAILDELISAKLNGSGKQLLSLADDRQYFNELTFSFNPENEIFVDCGAFNGDTILKYEKFTDGKCKKIYAFEPNYENVLMLQENTRSLSGEIEIINKGTWRENGKLEFEENGSASQIVKGGKVTIPVTTIDSVVGKDKITFIKMDVEGSELESLEGAKKIIERDMPKLAICCYHKQDDIIKIHQFIKKFNNKKVKYRFYLRHHSNSVYETVLYGIPTERN